MDAITLKSKFLFQLTDDEFFHFCQENRDLRIERNHKQEIIIMSPTGGKSGRDEGEAFGQLYAWNLKAGLGEVLSPSTGFKLPDTSIRSADASWISGKSWDQLSEEEQEKFLPLSPEFIIEVKSPSDSLPGLQEKMGIWIKNGVKVGILLDPKKERVFIYREDGHISTIEDYNQIITIGDLMPGFELDLKRFQ